MSVDNYDNRVASLTEEIVNERMESPRHVAEALDELSGTSDHNDEGNTQFAASFAAALLGNDSDWMAYRERVMSMVRTDMQREASSDAAFRVSKDEDDAAEARDTASSRWAA